MAAGETRLPPATLFHASGVKTPPLTQVVLTSALALEIAFLISGEYRQRFGP